MNLKNQRPVLVPRGYIGEVEALSKAALMDMVWSFATRCSGQEVSHSAIFEEFRRERFAILNARKAART